MPFVKVMVAGSLSREQRKQISQRISQALYDVAGKSPSATYIVFEEVERENWAVGDRLLDE